VPEKWHSKLLEHRELAYISKQVATLRTDLTLDGNLQQLRLPIN
jgi:protein Xni